MPAFEYKLAGFYTAETDEEHKEQQYRLSMAAYGFQDRSCSMDMGNLSVDEINPRTRYHADNQHPVLQKFE
jgi:hypothetical protein